MDNFLPDWLDRFIRKYRLKIQWACVGIMVLLTVFSLIRGNIVDTVLCGIFAAFYLFVIYA